MQLTEIRQKYPQYSNISDEELTQKLYKRFYAGKFSFDDFAAKVGHTPARSPEMGTMEKAEGVAGKMAEGLTFGLGDIVAGATNIPANIAAGNFKNPVKLFKEGRRDFISSQNKFSKQNPNLAMAAEVAGGLLTGVGGASKVAGAKALSKLGKVGQSVVTGAAGGAAYGAGSGLTADEDKLSLANALKQGAAGAVVGGGFGAATPFIGRGANIALNKADDLRRAISGKTALALIRKKGGQEAIDAAVRGNIPLLDIIPSRGANLGKIAKRANDEAADILDPFIERKYAAQGADLTRIIKKASPKTGLQSADEFLASKRALSEQAYKPLEALKPLTDVDVSNPHVRRAIDIVRRNIPEYRKLQSNDFKVLNEAKKILDIQTRGVALSGDEATLKYWRDKARHKLIDDMDAAIAKNIHGVEYDFSAGIPEITSEMMYSKTPYKYLLGQYGDLLSAEKALAAGREFLNTDPELVAKMFQGAGPAEQEAMKIGLADALLMQSRKSSVDGSTRNVASNLVGSEQNKQIFRHILGKQADGFINDLSSMAKANKNYGIVSRGSDTAENLENIRNTKNIVSRAGGDILGMIGEGIETLGARTNKKRQLDIATLLTNPEALKKALAEESSRKALFNINPVDLSGAGGSFANIPGPLTSSEKDIYRKTVKKNLLDNLRGSSVNTADGKNVAFGRAGIDKAIGSSNNGNKIKMLENIPEILKKSVQYYPSITKDRTKFDYMAAPINIDGRSKNALATLRNNYFYNVNDLDWATKRKLQRVVAETSGSQAEASTNSLPNKSKKIKTSIADFLILSARPFNTGRTGVSLADILINRKQEKK